ncbi:MAG: BON domain-containing protein [Ignavibacteriales bacterium]
MKLLFISMFIVSGLVLGGVNSFAADTEVKGNTHKSVGQYIDDSAITTKVKAALLADPDVSGLDVKVKTYKGVVQLSGFVNSPQQASRAVRIAQDVDGVRKVEDKLTVKRQQ